MGRNGRRVLSPQPREAETHGDGLRPDEDEAPPGTEPDRVGESVRAIGEVGDLSPAVPVEEKAARAEAEKEKSEGSRNLVGVLHAGSSSMGGERAARVPNAAGHRQIP